MKLIFLGPPGAGKGTISQLIIEDFKIVQISTGDLLRAAVKEGSELGKKAKKYMDKGELVPDALVINLLKERISKEDCKKGFILDGFPRTIAQAEELEKVGIDIDKVINFMVDDKLIIYRLSGRRISKSTGKIFNVNEGCVPQHPKDWPKDDLYQRDDDKEEAIRNRLIVYRKQTGLLIDFYKKRKLLVDIDASKDIDRIVRDVKNALRK